MDTVQKIKDLIVEAINNKNVDLEKELYHYHEKDIADAYLLLNGDQRAYFRDNLPDQLVSDVFTYIDNIEAIESLDKEEIADIIELMDSDDAIDVLEQLEEGNRDEIVDLMEGEIKADIKMISSFNEDEVGSLMTNNYIKIDETCPVKKAMTLLTSEASDISNISTIYVVNGDKYVGTIDLVDLIKARANTNLNTIIRQNTPFIYANELIEDSLVKIKSYNLETIPVLDQEKNLIGVITSDDIADVIDEQIGEDYAKLAGLSSEDDLNEPFINSIKKRFPWLLCLLILSVFISLLISRFEHVIMIMTVIVFFQSMVLDMSGNVGTQALAVTIRVISDEKDNKKLIYKELKIGFINGLILGILAFLVVFIFLLITHGEVISGQGFNIIHTIRASLIVGLSMTLSISICNLFGSIVPIILNKMKIDPAAASGPFITTLNDCIAILCYYGLAILMFMSFL